MLKKTLAIVLAFTMLFALAIPALAENPDTAEENVFHYVSLGASNSNGYALHGYLTEDMYANPVLSGAQTGTPGDISGYRRTPEGSYPDLVAKHFEELGYVVDHDQLAQSSMRVEELRFLLDPSFTADDYTQWRFYNPDNSWTWWYSNLDAIREDYEQSIKEADLITYDMGLNNFGVYLTSNLLDNTYGNDLHRVVDPKYADMYYSIRGELEKGISALSFGVLNEDLFKTLDNMKDTLAYAILGYCVNFDATIKIIRDWNPDATIVVMNVQNIMAGLEVSVSGIVLPLGDILNVAMDIANTYTSLLSPYACKYFYADTTENGRATCFMDQLMDYNGDPETLDLDMRDCMDAYDTTLPMYLRFRVAERLAANMGDETAIAALSSNNSSTFKNNLPYFVEYCEKNCPELYEKTLTNAYDVMATVLQAAISTNPVPVDSMISGGSTGPLENELKNGLFKIINDVTAKNIEGGTFDDADIQNVINELFYNDGMKMVAAIGVRASIGNTFFSHPNREGCKELYDSIMGALDGKIVGSRAFVKMLSSTSKSVVKGTVKFGAQFPKLIMCKIASALGIDKNVATALANSGNDVEEVESILYNDAGIDNMEKLQEFEEGVSASSTELAKTETQQTQKTQNDTGSKTNQKQTTNIISTISNAIQKLSIKNVLKSLFKF